MRGGGRLLQVVTLPIARTILYPWLHASAEGAYRKSIRVDSRSEEVSLMSTDIPERTDVQNVLARELSSTV